MGIGSFVGGAAAGALGAMKLKELKAKKDAPKEPTPPLQKLGEGPVAAGVKANTGLEDPAEKGYEDAGYASGGMVMGDMGTDMSHCMGGRDWFRQSMKKGG